jgi:site-specific DNA-cytosine methylase
MMWQRLEGVRLDQQPLKWNVSGPMCTPYSMMGDRKLGADPSMESWHTWSASVAASDHDLATCENSDEMPEELFDGKMSMAGPHAWFVVPLILNTTDMGWPSRRRRSWQTAFNEETMIWLGPRKPWEIQQHFMHFFRHTVELDGDVLLLSSEEEHMSYKQELAKKQGNFARLGEDLSPSACMTPVAFNRFKVYESYHKQRLSQTAYIADISQTVDATRKRVGEILPAACTSSAFYSFTAQRFFTPADLKISQGWPLESSSLYGDLVRSKAGISSHAQKKAMGNGMHLAQVGAVFLYICSFTMRRETAIRMLPIPTAPSVRPLAAAPGVAEMEGVEEEEEEQGDQPDEEDEEEEEEEDEEEEQQDADDQLSGASSSKDPDEKD